MATTHTIGRLNGSHFALALEVFVHNLDPHDTTPITIGDVYTEINGAGDIPTDVAGLPDDGNPSIQQISATLWKVGIKYANATLRPLVSSSDRAGFAFHLGRKFVKWAPEVDVFGSSLSMGGFVNVVPQPNGGNAVGVWLEPPSPNLTKTVSVPIGTVTGSWVRGIAAIVGGGYVNSATMNGGAYAAGEVLVTHIIGVQTTASLMQIDIGWNWKDNVSGESRGGISGIDYDGQDFVWDFEEPNVDRSAVVLAKTLKAVIVNRVRPRIDLNAIGIVPP